MHMDENAGIGGIVRHEIGRRSHRACPAMLGCIENPMRGFRLLPNAESRAISEEIERAFPGKLWQVVAAEIDNTACWHRCEIDLSQEVKWRAFRGARPLHAERQARQAA